METVKKETVEQTVEQVLAETAQAANEHEPLERGDVVAEEAVPVKRRKRTTRKKKEEEPPQAASVDVLTPLIGMAVTGLAVKKLNRKPEDMQFTDEEKKVLSQIAPDFPLNKPSWPAYIITAVSMVVCHYFASSPVEKTVIVVATDEQK